MSRPPNQHLAAGDHGRRLQHAQDGVGDGRLAAARFAGQANDLAGANLERDAVDGPHRSARRQVFDLEVVDRDQRRTIVERSAPA